MRIPRLHTDCRLLAGEDAVLSPQAATHAVRVLRLRAGDAVILFNGDGYEYPARLLTSDTRAATVQVESRIAPARESSLHITLAQALARGEKMDWIVQKATELGATAIAPLTTERSEVKLDDARATKRLEHWRAIAIAACEQSGRCVVPTIAAPVPLEAWLASLGAPDNDARLVLHPGDAVSPRMLRPASSVVTLTIGPEGGFGDRDLQALHRAGFRDLSLGPRILRTETAGVAAVAALQALYGDL